jgi:hypothetical protein
MGSLCLYRYSRRYQRVTPRRVRCSVTADHYQESTYGDAIADTYDDLYGTFLADPVQIKTLADLAGDGPAVEIGSGTGRVALPLARAGVPVVGIDASGEMTRQLHRSAVAEGLAVTAVEAVTQSIIFTVCVTSSSTHRCCASMRLTPCSAERWRTPPQRRGCSRRHPAMPG